MKSRFCFLLLTGLLSFPSFGQKTIKESLKVTTPPVIDAQMDDWTADWQMNSKTKFLYNFANDSGNIYLRLKIADPLMQQKVLLFGLSVLLNAESTTKTGKVGLHYPLAKSEDEMKRMSSDQGTDKPWNEVKKSLVKSAEVLELIGISKAPVSSPTVGLTNGLEVVIAVDKFGDLVYETKIPFTAFHLDKSKIEDLGVTVETGRLVIKQPINSPKATYYHGVRYAAPANTQPQNAFTQNTTLHLAFKLN